MKLIRFLFRKSGWLLWVSILAGLASGAGLSNVMRLTHLTLEAGAAAGAAYLLPFAVSLIVFAVAAVISEKIMINFSETFRLDLRHTLARQLLRSELRPLEQAGQDRIWNVLINDVEECASFVCWLPNAFVNLAIVTGCFLYIVWLSPAAAVFNLGFVLLGALAYKFSTRRVRRLRREANLAWERMYGRLRYLTQGIKSLLLSRPKSREFLHRHLHHATAEVRDRAIPARTLHSVTERFAEALVLIDIGCLLFLLPHFHFQVPGAREGLILAVLFMLSPLKTLLDVVPKAVTAQVALERITALGLDVTLPPESGPDLPTDTAPARDFRELTLENVTFAYETPAGSGEAAFGIGPISFALRAGETLFLVGGNGSGKTTLAKVVCGLYPPAAGTLRVNGRAVDPAAREEHRQLFATVFADDPLFDHMLGLPPGSLDRRAGRLLADLRLDHKVTLQGEQFSTTDLSQGQKRRLLLLNALLEDRPVLIFDEWAAEQDPQFRQLFYDHFLPGLRGEGRAVLVITHDDRYFDRADRILKLERGRLADDPAVAVRAVS